MNEFKWIKRKDKCLLVEEKLFDSMIECFQIYEEREERNDKIKEDIIFFLERKWTDYEMSNADFQYLYNLARRINK